MTKTQKTVLSLMLISAFSACKKGDVPENNLTAGKTSIGNVTPFFSVPPMRSVDFDWESSTTIAIHGVQVTLPWVSGANTTIPAHVLNEMSAKNGWELYYNFPGWIYSGPNQNYLIFHNKFTGLLRFFCYNTVNSTDNTVGLFNFQLEGSKPTFTLNTASPYIQRNPDLNTSSVHSNSSDGKLTGFRSGWNSFDVPLVYDPTVNTSSDLKFSVFSDRRAISEIKLTGEFSSETEGELVSKGTSNPFTGAKDAISKASGDGAKNLLKKWIDGGKIKTPDNFLGNLLKDNGPNLIGGLIKSGIGGIFSSLIGGFGSPTQTDQSISLSTHGKLNLSGSLITGNPGPIESIKSVPLPGTDYSNGGFLPSKDVVLGSWDLASQPEVHYTTTASGSGQWLTQGYSINTSAISVVLNPAIAGLIESYSVTAELWYGGYEATSLPKPVKSGSGPGNAVLIGGGLSRASNIRHINQRWVELRDPKYVTAAVNGYDGNFVVKVFVTIKPKAPYNTNDIVMSRSYAPKFIAQ